MLAQGAHLSQHWRRGASPIASIFLSYGRADSEQARSIAAALEKTGHSVWWDKHIGGGTQYAKEIEQALNSADVVVVLWSPSSVDSAWVRDEAGSGRDRGRLVPLSIDATPPPLGFRQFQSIDLGRWPGRGKVPRFGEILAAIERQSKEPGIPGPAQTMPVHWVRGRMRLNAWLAIGMAVGLLFIVLGLAVSRPWEQKAAGVPTLAVRAANSSANGLAHDLLASLGNLQSVQSGAVRLLAESAGQRPDLMFEVSTANAESRSGNLTLMKGGDRSILWAKQFDRSSGSLADLNRLMTYAAGRVLDCAVEGEQPGGRPLRPQTLKLYLTGCSQMAEASSDTLPSVVRLFEQVVKDAPGLKGAWAKLLLTKSDTFGGPNETSAARQSFERQIKQARQLDPKMPEATLAEVTLLPTKAYGEALRLLDQAHESHPDNALILEYRAHALMRVGRFNDAIDDAKLATNLDPTSLDALGNYVLTLAYSGRVDAAKEQLQLARRRFPATGKLSDLQYSFQLRFGDPKDLLKTEAFKQSPPAWQMYIRTKIDPTPANVERLMAFLRELYVRRGFHVGDVVGHAQPYGELHRENDLYRLISQVPPDEDMSLFSEVAFRPSLHKFRQDPRFMIVAKRMGLVDYWTNSGKWPDFCFTDPDQPYDCKAEAAKLK